MDLSISTNKNNWIENFARFGYAAKGVVYCLIGIMAVIAAFGSGSSNQTGKNDIFGLILEQPFGKILLAIVAFGLMCYVIWRLIEAIKDPEHKGSDTKGILTRIGYGISAIVYFVLSIYAWKMVFNGNKGGGGNTEQNILSKIMDYNAGQVLVAIVAIILVAKGIQQIYKAISGKYRKELEEGRINHKYRNILVKAGGIGYIARGIVWAVVGFLFFKASLHSNAGEAGGTENALKFLEDFGPAVLGLVAIGLICYGIFKILEALYKRIPV